MSSSTDSGHGDEEPYPPWMEAVLDAEAANWDEVVVMEAGSDRGKHKGWREVKNIVVPDAFEAASGKGPGECRTVHIKRFATILIASEPFTPPYIGLVDKVFRRRGAQKVREVNGNPVYRQADFGIQAYWFYRPSEDPPSAWGKHLKLRQATEGKAQYKLPAVDDEELPDVGEGKPDVEEGMQKEVYSEREIMFSSHHTLQDYPQQQGILALDGFLQACKVHWLGSTVKEAVLRYEVHGGEVLELKQGGFVVRGFLWCAAKGEPQLDARYKKVHLLEKCDWPDQETRDIVRQCMQGYQANTVSALIQHNERVMERVRAAQKANPNAPLASDSGTDSDDDHDNDQAAAGPGAPGDEDRDTASDKHTNDDQAAGAPSSGTPSRPSAKKSPRKTAAAAAGGAGSSRAGAAGSSPAAKKASPGKAAAAAAAGGAGSSRAAAAAQGSSPRLGGVSDDPSAAGAAAAAAAEYPEVDDVLNPGLYLDMLDDSD